LVFSKVCLRLPIDKLLTEPLYVIQVQTTQNEEEMPILLHAMDLSIKYKSIKLENVNQHSLATSWLASKQSQQIMSNALLCR